MTKEFVSVKYANCHHCGKCVRRFHRQQWEHNETRQQRCADGISYAAPIEQREAGG